MNPNPTPTPTPNPNPTYVQAMKASMVDRMQEMHARQMGNVSEGFEEKLGPPRRPPRPQAAPTS